LDKISKQIAELCNQPRFSVEIYCDKPQFPFKLFKKKPYNDSRKYDCPDGDSFALYGFERISNARDFALDIKKKAKMLNEFKGLKARLFVLNEVRADFDWEMLRI
jgi:hypothetical protein